MGCVVHAAHTCCAVLCAQTTCSAAACAHRPRRSVSHLAEEVGPHHARVHHKALDTAAFEPDRHAASGTAAVQMRACWAGADKHMHAAVPRRHACMLTSHAYRSLSSMPYISTHSLLVLYALKSDGSEAPLGRERRCAGVAPWLAGRMACAHTAPLKLRAHEVRCQRAHAMHARTQCPHSLAAPRCLPACCSTHLMSSQRISPRLSSGEDTHTTRAPGEASLSAGTQQQQRQVHVAVEVDAQHRLHVCAGSGGPRAAGAGRRMSAGRLSQQQCCMRSC